MNSQRYWLIFFLNLYGGHPNTSLETVLQYFRNSIAIIKVYNLKLVLKLLCLCPPPHLTQFLPSTHPQPRKSLASLLGILSEIVYAFTNIYIYFLLLLCHTNLHTVLSLPFSFNMVLEIGPYTICSTASF